MLTITTKFDKSSEGLLDYVKSKGFWDGQVNSKILLCPFSQLPFPQGDFNFAETFNTDKGNTNSRLESGRKLLEALTSSDSFRETDMFKVLRDTESDICRSCDSAFPTQGAQVSVLSTSRPSVHWFTATPDPSKSVFKPFIFTPNASISKHTYCAEDKVMVGGC